MTERERERLLQLLQYTELLQQRLQQQACSYWTQKRCLCVTVCVCVSVRERERERERCNVKSDVRSFSCFVFTGAKGGPRELTPQLTCKNTKLRALIYRHKNFCDGPTNHPNSTAPLPRSLSW